MGGEYDGRNTFYIGAFDEAMERDLVIPLHNTVKEQSMLVGGRIDMIVNSEGGYAHLAWHVVEMMELAKRYGIEVRTVVTGAAHSAGSIIAVAGTPGERYIAKGAHHIAHYGATSLGETTTPTQAHRSNDFSQGHFKKVIEHYRKYCDIPDIDKHISDDNWYIGGTQAKRWGMADKFIDKFSVW